jgi:hypothetical protein
MSADIMSILKIDKRHRDIFFIKPLHNVIRKNEIKSAIIVIRIRH